MPVNRTGRYTLDGGGRGTYNIPPRPPKNTPTPSKLPGSPGLLTSTGGLFGNTGLILVPFFDNILNDYYFALMDANNFDSEEPSEYDFKVEDINVGRSCTISKLVVIYRNIGKATVTFGVRAYLPLKKKLKDRIIEKTVSVVLGDTVGDRKLHTQNIDLVISGQRPQAFLRRDGSSGPYSIVSVTMVGNADETKLL